MKTRELLEMIGSDVGKRVGYLISSKELYKDVMAQPYTKNALYKKFCLVKVDENTIDGTLTWWCYSPEFEVCESEDIPRYKFRVTKKVRESKKDIEDLKPNECYMVPSSILLDSLNSLRVSQILTFIKENKKVVFSFNVDFEKLP